MFQNYKIKWSNQIDWRTRLDIRKIKKDNELVSSKRFERSKKSITIDFFNFYAQGVWILRWKWRCDISYSICSNWQSINWFFFKKFLFVAILNLASRKI